MESSKRIKLSVKSFYLDDNINDIYCEFGKTYLENNNIDEALKWFNNALDNSDSNVYYYLEIIIKILKILNLEILHSWNKTK